MTDNGKMAPVFAAEYEYKYIYNIYMMLCAFSYVKFSPVKSQWIQYLRLRLNCDVGKTSTRHIYTEWAMAFTKEGTGAAEGAKIKEDEQEQRIFVNNVRWLGKCPGCVLWPSDLLLWGRLTWFRASLVHLALYPQNWDLHLVSFLLTQSIYSLFSLWKRVRCSKV